MHHAEVLHPLQPARNIGRQVAAEKLRCQCVQGTDGDRHLHVHAQRSHEEPDALQMQKTKHVSIVAPRPTTITYTIRIIFILY